MVVLLSTTLNGVESVKEVTGFAEVFVDCSNPFTFESKSPQRGCIKLLAGAVSIRLYCMPLVIIKISMKTK